MQTTTVTSAAFNTCPLRQRASASPAPAAAYPAGNRLALQSRRRSPRLRRICCEVAVTTSEVSSSSLPAPSGSDAESEASSRIGARVRVKVPVKVYHVPKVPEIDLSGMEGEIKQYVGLWKGKYISANLPFKVAFVVPDGVEGRPGPLKFLAHLKEDEFEYLPLE